MKDGFIETKEELESILYDIHKSGYGSIGDSKLIEGYRFWNYTGSEFRPDFPTFYWSKKLEEQLERG